MTVAFGLSLTVACGDSGDGTPRTDPCESFFDSAGTSSEEICPADCKILDFDVRAKLEGCSGDPTMGGCHAGPNRILTVMEFDLSDPSSTLDGALSPLIDMLSSNGSYVIDSEDANRSYMLRKLTTNPGIGSRMPPPQSTESTWSNDEIECFRAHIQQTYGF